VRPRGSNLPSFLAQQLEFAAHIRNPETHPRPVDVEPRRMQIYLDLFYNNIESFLASGFPVAKRILDEDRWHALVREFLHRHPSSSPYFLEISQEFLTFLHETPPGNLPPFFLELCHYEWVELALTVAEEELPVAGIDPDGDLMINPVAVSPLLWKLAYTFPVHKLGPGFQPSSAPERPTLLLVHRRADDSVGFLEVTELTMRLLDELETAATGSRALERIAAEHPQLPAAEVCQKGLETLGRLRKAGVILGARLTRDDG
jgi:hypothetical protein